MNTYWNGKGKLQEQYTQLADELIPASGGCETLGGEVLRAATRIYWDAYNNGFLNNTSGALNFLNNNVRSADRESANRFEEALSVLESCVNTGGYTDFEPNDESDRITLALEEIVDTATWFAANDPARNNVPTGGGTYDLFDLQEKDEYYYDEDEDEIA